MAKNHDSVDNALGSLKSLQYPADDHINDLQTKLMGSYPTMKSASIFAKHRTLFVVLSVALIGGSAIATGVALRKQRLYDVKLSHNGELLSTPRILVQEGQSASLTVTDGDQTFTMKILEDGTIVYHGRDDIDVEVTVTEIDAATIDPKQASPEGSSSD